MKKNKQATKALQLSGAKKIKSEANDENTYERTRRTTGNTIFFFKDDEQQYGFFCQWYRCHFTDLDSGLEFNCTEQWIMWNKANFAGDVVTAKVIMATTSPRKQKQFGREVEGFDVEAWDKFKLNVVEQGNYLKFTQATDVASMKMGDVGEPVPLKDSMLATHERELAEASRFDRVWGIGFDAQQASTTPYGKWGQNPLGVALMNVRERIKDEDRQTADMA
ncbi:DUF1768-domain-containing protein [Aureobasidium subglaciale]|nr:DUF1768-domain-containing protein [Aureobasidium subglaciale]